MSDERVAPPSNAEEMAAKHERKSKPDEVETTEAADTTEKAVKPRAARRR